MIIWTFIDITTMLLFIGTVCYMHVQPESQFKTVAVLVIALFYLIAMFAINKVQKQQIELLEKSTKKYYLINSETGEKLLVSESIFNAARQIAEKFEKVTYMRRNK